MGGSDLSLGWAKLGSRSKPVANAHPDRIVPPLEQAVPFCITKGGAQICVLASLERRLDTCSSVCAQQGKDKSGLGRCSCRSTDGAEQVHLSLATFRVSLCRFSTKYWMSQTCTVCGKGMLFGLKCKNCKYGTVPELCVSLLNVVRGIIRVLLVELSRGLGTERPTSLSPAHPCRKL